MPHIEFDDALSIGNRLMDQEHRMLVSFINTLRDAVKNEASAKIVAQVVLGMMDYSRTHFFVEEELMKAYKYPEFAAHLTAHDAFRAKADELTRGLERDEVDINIVLVYLTEWWTSHIQKIDARLADFLKDKTFA